MALARRRPAPQWDSVIRGTGVVALLALYPTTRWPDVGALAAFLCITIFVNGPLAPLLPATYEPIQVIAGRAYPALIVAMIGVLGTCYIEFINYYLYRWAILHPRLEKARESQLVRVTVALFRRSPFLSVWLCALTPLPYWAVRFLAPLSGYAIGPYLLATFLGRLPRYYLIARFGRWLPLSDLVLAIVTVFMIATAVVVVVVRWLRARGAPDAAPLAPSQANWTPV